VRMQVFMGAFLLGQVLFGAWVCWLIWLDRRHPAVPPAPAMSRRSRRVRHQSVRARVPGRAATLAREWLRSVPATLWPVESSDGGYPLPPVYLDVRETNSPPPEQPADLGAHARARRGRRAA